jgi:hypothetical protein
VEAADVCKEEAPERLSRTEAAQQGKPGADGYGSIHPKARISSAEMDIKRFTD